MSSLFLAKAHLSSDLLLATSRQKKNRGLAFGEQNPSGGPQEGRVHGVRPVRP